MNAPTLRRALLYVRVSALMGRGGDDFHSPDIQITAGRRALSTHGLREVGVVDDDIDVSGTTFRRDGLDKIMQRAKARQFDVLVCYDTSRFGRDVLESLLFLRDLMQNGVHIVTTAEGIDTSTDHGMTMFINLLNMAQMRAREIARGWRSTIDIRTQAGKWHGRAPAGARRGDDGRLEPDPATWPHVEQALRAYADNEGVRRVRRRLCAQLDTTITESGFKRLLGNEAYRGVLVVAGRRNEHAHDPMIDAELWERVQRRLRRDRSTPAQSLHPRYCITGIAWCAQCEGPAGVTPLRRPGGADRGHGVFCRRARQGRGDCPGCGMLTLAGVEQEVLRGAAAYVGQLRGDVSAQEARAARAARAGTDAQTLERELTQTRAAMVRLTGRWARDPNADEAVYEAAMVELRESEQRLLGRLDQARDVAGAPTREGVIDLAEELLRLWPDMQAPERNQVLRQLGARVVVSPAQYRGQPARERVLVEWR